VILSSRSADGDAVLPVGTGPFRFGEWQRGQAITLLRNPDYWGVPARLERVVYRFIADPTAALAALNAGDVDAFDAFPAPENIAALQNDPRFVVHVGLSQGKSIMALNNARPPFNDRRVRQALSYAVDRQAVIDGAMFGHGQPIGSHYPPQDPDYLDLTGLYPHDPAKARALLAEAGFPRGFHVSLRLPPLPYARRSGEIIAAQLAEVGIDVDLINMEWMTWLDQVFTRHDYDMTVVAHIAAIIITSDTMESACSWRSAALTPPCSRPNEAPC
jgi:peptide/nickel transport system substrate-binding protein